MSEDVLSPVGGDAPDAEDAPMEAEAPAEGDAGGDEEEKEDEEEDGTPMVDIPIIEEKKKPRPEAIRSKSCRLTSLPRSSHHSLTETSTQAG